jgi:hypothetical protein
VKLRQVKKLAKKGDARALWVLRLRQSRHIRRVFGCDTQIIVRQSFQPFWDTLIRS